MYTIVSNGELLSICENPRYVRKKPETGVYIETSKETAEAIAVNGTLYNLPGSVSVPDAYEAFVSDADVGEFTFENHVKLDATGTAIENIETTICDADAATEDRLSAIEDAVCVLDSIINSGESE